MVFEETNERLANGTRGAKDAYAEGRTRHEDEKVEIEERGKRNSAALDGAVRRGLSDLGDWGVYGTDLVLVHREDGR